MRDLPSGVCFKLDGRGLTTEYAATRIRIDVQRNGFLRLGTHPVGASYGTSP